jgi:hypothetical protein
MNETNHISKKKLTFSIANSLRDYLTHYGREVKLPLEYESLLRWNTEIPLLNKNGIDTYWKTVFYNPSEMQEIYIALVTIYVILKSNGDLQIAQHLTVDRIDYCSFGNSHPFRIKIINKYNDNYDYFYVKKADASRIYGLELEHILSPNRIIYFTNNNTLIEEHIAGIPGDVFIKQFLNSKELNPKRLAKEFVKFNERCFIRLLGDMRSYNFIIDVTQDFDDVQYRIRAIDFDQQSFEGKKTLYLPQFFKENLPLVQLGMDLLTIPAVEQYRKEERALMKNRVNIEHYRLQKLLDVMSIDNISTDEKIKQLRTELADHYKNNIFNTCNTMGDIVYCCLNKVL